MSTYVDKVVEQAEIEAAREYYGDDKCIDHGIGACVVCWRAHEKFVGPGKKLDKGKPRIDMWLKLLPPLATMEVVEVLMFGVKKYSAWGWRRVIGWRWRYSAAAARHLMAYLMGSRTDDGEGGSKRHHLAGAICSLLFVLDNELRLEAGATDVPDGDAEGDSK